MLYELIKTLCKQNSITVSELERECGFARGSISKIDRHKPSAEKLQKIADCLNVSVNTLVGVPNSGQPSEYYINEETARIAQDIYENPYMRILFDAASGSSKSDLQMAADLLTRLKRTNPDG